MSADTTKQMKSFRLSRDIVKVVKTAAEDTGLSEADILESCVINQAAGVVALRDHLKTKDAVRNVAAAGVARARAERSDKGVAKVKRDSHLTKREQQ